MKNKLPEVRRRTGSYFYISPIKEVLKKIKELLDLQGIIEYN